jgi:hypothetical protein
VFGKSNEVSADVYLSPDNATIVGAELNLNLDTPVRETDFDTMLDKISTSILVDYNRDLTLNRPESFITEKELETIMKRYS